MSSDTENKSLRRTARLEYPEFPWLELGEPEAVERILRERNCLRASESVESITKAGEGNMNLTLRIRTDQRSLIVKQARPWVEKYDHIAAPWDRILFEQRFYQKVSRIPEVIRMMPRVLLVDTDARMILLDDLGDASDCTDLYRGWGIYDAEIRQLAVYLRRLHDASEGAPDPAFANREMRALNHEHIFVIPLEANNGVNLEDLELWLPEKADELRANAAFVERVRDLGARYLADGRHLLHGDFFPGSWLRTEDGLRVIDPEFCFYGCREWDLGVAVGHLRLSCQDFDFAKAFLSIYQETDEDATFDVDLVKEFAAIEIMRRVLGVAQLPIPTTQGLRAELLNAARDALLGGSIEDLWL